MEHETLAVAIWRVGSVEKNPVNVGMAQLRAVVPLGEAHLRRAITEFVQHYHQERNHQSLENTLIAPDEVTDGSGKVVRRDRLGGLLGLYYREAA